MCLFVRNVRLYLYAVCLNCSSICFSSKRRRALSKWIVCIRLFAHCFHSAFNSILNQTTKLWTPNFVVIILESTEKEMRIQNGRIYLQRYCQIYKYTYQRSFVYVHIHQLQSVTLYSAATKCMCMRETHTCRTRPEKFAENVSNVKVWATTKLIQNIYSARCVNIEWWFNETPNLKLDFYWTAMPKNVLMFNFI